MSVGVGGVPPGGVGWVVGWLGVGVVALGSGWTVGGSGLGGVGGTWLPAALAAACAAVCLAVNSAMVA